MRREVRALGVYPGRPRARARPPTSFVVAAPPPEVRRAPLEAAVRGRARREVGDGRSPDRVVVRRSVQVDRELDGLDEVAEERVLFFRLVDALVVHVLEVFRKETVAVPGAAARYDARHERPRRRTPRTFCRDASPGKSDDASQAVMRRRRTYVRAAPSRLDEAVRLLGDAFPISVDFRVQPENRQHELLAIAGLAVAVPATAAREVAAEDVERFDENLVRRRERPEARRRGQVHVARPVPRPATHDLRSTPRAAPVGPRAARDARVRVNRVGRDGDEVVAGRRKRRQRRDRELLLAPVPLRDRDDVEPDPHAVERHVGVLADGPDRLAHRADVDALRVRLVVPQPLVAQKHKHDAVVHRRLHVSDRVVDDQRVSEPLVRLELLQGAELVAGEDAVVRLELLDALLRGDDLLLDQHRALRFHLVRPDDVALLRQRDVADAADEDDDADHDGGGGPDQRNHGDDYHGHDDREREADVVVVLGFGLRGHDALPRSERREGGTAGGVRVLGCRAA
mmetsp:Transcript_1248/g.3488  ORF Transcript_1248/g.3488 Transcript_1248/m.3488 type:complete len:512 (-) Transcript_1248:189-1724(-)